MSYDPSHRMPPRQEQSPAATPAEGWPSYRDGEQEDLRYGTRRATAGHRQQAVATAAYPAVTDDFDGNGYGRADHGYPGGSVGYADTNDGYAGADNRYARAGDGYGWPDAAYAGDGGGYDWSRGGYTSQRGLRDAEAPGGTRGRTAKRPQAAELPLADQQQALALASQVADALAFDEETTRRRLIDSLLVAAGWNVGANGASTEQVGQEVEVDHQPTPSGKGKVDYVLWGDNGKPLGVIEARNRRRSDPRPVGPRRSATPMAWRRCTASARPSSTRTATTSGSGTTHPESRPVSSTASTPRTA